MAAATKAKRKEKVEMHSRNKFREQYDFKLLVRACPELAAFIQVNEHQIETIDYFNPRAVKMLNKALVKYFYGITHWDIPKDFLCPPVPGRADYIHYAADLLASSNQQVVPVGKNVKCLDIGVGANCIYPIIGHKEYGWSFVGSEIDDTAIKNAKSIIDLNKGIKGAIEIRKQSNSRDFFKNIFQKNEFFDMSICNPPFYTSLAEAHGMSKRKVESLKRSDSKETEMNFGGQKNELWCEGGEARFIERMILQSKEFEKQCLWYTTLVSKENHLKRPYELLQKLGASEVRTIKVAQGHKISRILAWTYFIPEHHAIWAQERWHEKK